MNFRLAMALSATIAFAGAIASAQAQTCPAGQHPWVDKWGNKICKRFGDDSTASVQTRPGQTCPTGSFPTVDSWGNKVCREQGGSGKPATDYYDTSKGCPTGTHPWTDEWGNKICKKF